jgi:cold shock CspA family protein
VGFLMRTHGTLTKWNDDRGFGFVSPASGGEDLFVHITAFPRDGGRPRLHECISFETETGPNGKMRAVRVQRPGVRPVPRRSGSARRSTPVYGLARAVFMLATLAAIGSYAYSRWKNPREANAIIPLTSAIPESSADFSCDGRTRCAQMHSCAEARYFLQNCPGTKMDGDDDGEPCEQQWCN